jgi:hypothetical protein
MGIKRDFKSNAALNERYAGQEGQVIQFIRSKARRWSARGAGDVDDLVQEGRLALLSALEKWDPAVGPLHKYLGRVLDNTYGSMLAFVLAQRRAPYVWERDEAEGEWKRVPYPVLGISAPPNRTPGDFDSDGMFLGGLSPIIGSGLVDENTPEELAVTSETAGKANNILIRITHRLTDIQKGVLGCIVRPPAGLLITARNLTGAYEVRLCHIAMYLGITKNQVDHSIAVIRRHIMELSDEMDGD